MFRLHSTPYRAPKSTVLRRPWCAETVALRWPISSLRLPTNVPAVRVVSLFDSVNILKSLCSKNTGVPCCLALFRVQRLAKRTVSVREFSRLCCVQVCWLLLEIPERQSWQHDALFTAAIRLTAGNRSESERGRGGSVRGQSLADEIKRGRKLRVLHQHAAAAASEFLKLTMLLVLVPLPEVLR